MRRERLIALWIVTFFLLVYTSGFAGCLPDRTPCHYLRLASCEP